jgi:hypothetical protein
MAQSDTSAHRELSKLDKSRRKIFSKTKIEQQVNHEIAFWVDRFFIDETFYQKSLKELVKRYWVKGDGDAWMDRLNDDDWDWDALWGLRVFKSDLVNINRAIVNNTGYSGNTNYKISNGVDSLEINIDHVHIWDIVYAERWGKPVWNKGFNKVGKSF